MSFTPIYEKNLTTSLCHVDTIRLNEYDLTGYVYSGITLILDLTNFTTHFDTTGHTYSNVILNNDVYSYTGLTGETHYFTIYDYYSGGTRSIDPLLTGMTEDNIISGFTTTIIPCTAILQYSGNCCPTQVVKSNLPWVAITNEGGGVDNCEPFIARRTEKGWTLDFVFNKDGLPWTNNVFFYTGVRDEYDPAMYCDNNLSFAFTSDGRIKWSSYRYSGYCDSISGYTEMYYISTGQTFPLCPNGTSNDFNITITFERYYEYVDCELANEGGWNDLIHTGVTSTSGSTIIPDTQIEQLSNLWLKERNKRLGTLKIYHNGRPLQIEVPLSPISNFRNLPVYKVKDFEEIVLSDRGFQPFVHAVGGGVTGSGNLHNSVCCYDIKYAAYFEDVMTAQYIRDKYLNITKSNYSITECWEDCIDEVGNILSFRALNAGDVFVVPSNVTEMEFKYIGETGTTATIIISGITFTIASTGGTINEEFIWDYYNVNGNYHNFGSGNTGSITIIVLSNAFIITFRRGSLYFTLETTAMPTPTPTASPTPTPTASPTPTPTPLPIDMYIDEVFSYSMHTLKDAFDFINEGSVSGDIILKIIGNVYETSSAILNSSQGGQNFNTITIYPIYSGLSISGNIDGDLIKFNDTEDVVIDGGVNQSGITSLTIENTSYDVDASTIHFTTVAIVNINFTNIIGRIITDGYWSYTIGPNRFGGYYPTLKDAFDDINLGGIAVNIILEIVEPLIETMSCVLNASGVGPANYASINIYPIYPELSISGNINGDLIRFSGTTNVHIDGRVNQYGSNSLTIENTHIGGSPNTIHYIGVTNTDVLYSNVIGNVLTE